jgi:uncharacterized OsmC-like protein
MTELESYLERKRAAMAARQADWTANRAQSNVRISASSTLAGSTGVRATRMGDHFVASDSGPGLAGHGLGPTAPELLLGAMASCLVHTYVIHAILLEVKLEAVTVEVSGRLDFGAVVGLPFEPPLHMTDLEYRPQVQASASADQIEALHLAVEDNCAVLNTVRLPSTVTRVRE